MIQFGAASGFSGTSCLKSFRCPEGMKPQHVLVPSVASGTDSGRGVFQVDALVVFSISPDAGFDLDQLERAGLSQHSADAAGLMLPKVGALLERIMCDCLCESAPDTHAVFAFVAGGFARA